MFTPFKISVIKMLRCQFVWQVVYNPLFTVVLAGSYKSCCPSLAGSYKSCCTFTCTEFLCHRNLPYKHTHTVQTSPHSFFLHLSSNTLLCGLGLTPCLSGMSLSLVSLILYLLSVLHLWYTPPIYYSVST